MESELYKNRSLGRCLSDAYDLYRTNFKTIIRRLWLPALVLSLLTAAGYTGYTDNVLTTTTASLSGGTFAAIAVLAVLCLCAYVWLFTIVVSLLNGKSVKVNLPRMIRLTLALLGVLVVAYVLVAIIAVACAIMTTAPKGVLVVGPLVGILGCIVVGVLVLPFFYSVMKYCVETDLKVMAIFKGHYLAGWRQWGFLFVIALLVGIIMMVIDHIVGMPSIILALVSGMRHISIMEGDSPVMPSGFGLLAFLTAAVCTFVMTFVRPWVVFVFYYAYGCIEEKEKARMELKKAEKSLEPNEMTNDGRSLDFEEIK